MPTIKKSLANCKLPHAVIAATFSRHFTIGPKLTMFFFLSQA